MDSVFYERLRGFGDSLALVDADGRSWDYATLSARADQARQALGGVRRLVFLEAPSRSEMVAAYLGCLAGHHPVYLFHPSDREKTLALAEKYRPNAIIDFANGEWNIDWRHRDAIELHPDLRLLLSTSGSTGSAKFVKLSQKNIHANAESIAQYLQLTASERAITVLKLHYSYGMSVLNSHLVRGGALILNEASVTEPQFWQAFRTYGATSFAGVPYTFETLQRMDVPYGELKTLRYATQAGGRLAPELVRDYAERFNRYGWRFYVMYGQTEAAPRIAYLPPDKTAAFPHCIGIPIPGGEIVLLDEAGEPVAAADTPGQLSYRGPNVMMGYAETTADLASDETPAQLLTGDIACRNSEGLFYIVGRSARFVKPFGVRVNLDEVEADFRKWEPNSVCTGDDNGIVIAIVKDSAEDRAAAIAALAARCNLAEFVFSIAEFDELPRLGNGKYDYQAILAAGRNTVSVTAPRPDRMPAWRLPLEFCRAFFFEAAKILGLAKSGWEGVAEIFRALLGKRQVADGDSFTSLGGDSLSYVQVTLALEEYLGRIPAGWEQMSVAELEQSKADEAVI
jgi:acyl-CoA synthetase (AMP-forming)/AMP-acid ligase II